MRTGDKIKLTSKLHNWTINQGYKKNDTGIVKHADENGNCWARMDKSGKRYFMAKKEIQMVNSNT